MFLRSAVGDASTLQAAPGTVVAVDSDAFTVAAQPGGVRILEIQEAGRAPMSVKAYLNGRRVAVGETLTPLPEPPE
jgi:methionyl-tRNA formyltransferase